ncbi:MAG: amino acid permease, partial [Chitinophagales bacterium]|nr:amino acid permease [Chitinophagales bacterium]
MGFSNLFRRKSVPQILKDAEEGVIDQEHIIKLSRALNVRDLTMFGIAAIIGAGIFGTIGQASFDGGPAVSLLFIFIAIACGFAALCYAEFASMIPISGSAYTYSYAAFGELIAWIIGWDLLMEYAIGNIAVAQSWSAYFQTFIAGFGLKLPAFLTIDFISAYNSREAGDASTMAYQAWSAAPHLGPIPIIVDLPALFLIVFITWLIYIGIKESRAATNAMVILKIIVVIVIIMVGLFYVNPANWTPFMPNGVGGVMKGVAAVFFAYIGFDAISTTAEECENPQRDLPKGMINSLIICTILYVAISFVLTGMTSYTNLAVRDPLAAVFTLIPSLHWLSGVIALSAIIATASVFLVFQLGQPRIWMSMSRDGLLPKKFSKIHPKYRTPAFATIITGLFTALPILFLNFSVVINLTSIGTLFAFAFVCAGVVVIHHRRNVHYARVKLQEDKNPEVTDQNDFPEGKFKV